MSIKTLTAPHSPPKVGDIVRVSMTPAQPCRIVSLEGGGVIVVEPIGQPLRAYPGDSHAGDPECIWEAV